MPRSQPLAPSMCSNPPRPSSRTLLARSAICNSHLDRNRTGQNPLRSPPPTPKFRAELRFGRRFQTESLGNFLRKFTDSNPGTHPILRFNIFELSSSIVHRSRARQKRPESREPPNKKAHIPLNRVWQPTCTEQRDRDIILVRYSACAMGLKAKSFNEPVESVELSAHFPGAPRRFRSRSPRFRWAVQASQRTRQIPTSRENNQ
jgi:hypothetical protein